MVDFLAHFMRNGWDLRHVLKHTYYQLKAIYEADMKALNRHYVQISVAQRVSQAKQEDFSGYVKDMLNATN